MTSGSLDTELLPVSLVELVAERLRAEILAGALVPGERLVEEQLTRRFGTSRAPLREALRRLAEQGLVEHLPRRGVRVTTFSDRDFDELFGVRDTLERYAMSLLAAGGVDPGAAPEPVQEALDALDRAAAAGDRLGASEAHRAFHIGLVALAGSRQLSLAYEPVIAKLQLYMAANLRREADQGSPADGVRRHRRLLAAVLSGDAGRIAEQLDHHGARRYF